jgi:hypothetical protein
MDFTRGREMKISILIGACFGFFLFLTLYIFGTFSYIMLDDSIIIKWKILKHIPFSSYEIDVSKIQSIRAFKFKNDIIAGCRILGNLFVKKGVIIQLKRGFAKNIYITPENPSTFIHLVTCKMKNLGCR